MFGRLPIPASPRRPVSHLLVPASPRLFILLLFLSATMPTA